MVLNVFGVYLLWIILFTPVTTPAQVEKVLFDDYDIPIEEFVLCRRCGAPVTDTHYVAERLSPTAIHATNTSLFGRDAVPVQLVKSSRPLTDPVLVFTVSHAYCRNFGDWKWVELWFPRHVWRVCSCTDCGGSVGWQFVPIDVPFSPEDTFAAIDLPQVIGQHFTNSLLITPAAAKPSLSAPYY